MPNRALHDHVVVAFITSQVSAVLDPPDIVIDPTDGDFAPTGLRVALAIRRHCLMTSSTGGRLTGGVAAKNASWASAVS